MELDWASLKKKLPEAKCKQLIAATKLDSADNISLLSERYARHGIALVTGAGVSTSAGVPTWSGLISRLRIRSLKSTLAADGSRVLGDMIDAVTSGDSPLIAARSVIASIGSQDELKSEVRRILYSSVQESALLSDLAGLCTRNEGVSGVADVITYNYDGLLEEYLQRISRHTRVLYGQLAIGEGLPIRHVHGYLGRSPVRGDGIVLSEQSYHDEYARPYSWSNVVQINAFRERSCLFVGSSMSDPNQRRLLEAARRETGSSDSVPHFAILKRTSTTSVLNSIGIGWGQRGRPSDAEKRELDLRLRAASALVDGSKNDSLLDLGVRTIWVDDYADISDVIWRVKSR